MQGFLARLGHIVPVLPGGHLEGVTAGRGGQTQVQAPTGIWIWPAYYTIAVLWIVSGVGGILEALNVGPFATTIKFQDVKIEPGVNLIGLVFSGISAVIGLGLLVKIEIIRGVVNVVCFLQIVNGLLGLWAGIMASAFLGPIGLFITIMNIVDIVTGALMIYILGETD